MKLLVKFGCAAAIAGACGLVQADVTLNHSDYASDAEAGAALVSAVNGASANSTITVGAGRWLVSEAGTVRVAKKGTVLKGASSNPRDTVIDGGGVTNVMEVSGANTFICCLTVTNGVPRLIDGRGFYDGGGFFVTSSSAVVSNCVATGCHFDTRIDYLNGLPTAKIDSASGAGAYLSSGKIVDSLIENCWVYNGRINQGSTTGAGLKLSYAVASNCTIRGCSARTLASGAGTTVLIGGGVIVCSGAKLRHCQVYANAIESLNAGSRGYGGGLGINGDANTLVEDCCIYCNTNLNNASPGGGVGMVGAGTIRRSTITNNYAYANGGGFHVESMNNCRIYDCLIAGNKCAGSGGGGYGYLFGEGNVISNNVANAGSSPGAWYGGMVVVSNTLFVANQGDPSALRMQNSGGNPSLISGCWFVQNKPGKTVLNYSGTGNRRLTMRNCFFYDNRGQSMYVLGQNSGGEVATNQIDNCTFYEPNYSGDFVWRHTDISRANGNTNNWFRNCVFYDNAKWASGVPYMFGDAWSNQVSNNYDKVGTYLPKDGSGNPLNGNLTLAHDGEPGFVDAAAGDCRPAKNALIRGAGLLLDWMCDKDGNPDKKVVDAGSGSYTIRKVGDYGIFFDVGKRRPRVEKGASAPSIGCFEYYQIPGLLLMVR